MSSLPLWLQVAVAIAAPVGAIAGVVSLLWQIRDRRTRLTVDAQITEERSGRILTIVVRNIGQREATLARVAIVPEERKDEEPAEYDMGE